MKFDNTKSDTLNLHVLPSFKLALKAAPKHEQRSMVNMLEVLAADYCNVKGIVLLNSNARIGLAQPAERTTTIRTEQL